MYNRAILALIKRHFAGMSHFDSYRKVVVLYAQVNYVTVMTCEVVHILYREGVLIQVHTPFILNSAVYQACMDTTEG